MSVTEARPGVEQVRVLQRLGRTDIPMKKNREHQLVIPISLTQKVIKTNHDPLTVAHPGISRTLYILCLLFYRPRMRRHVEEYVKTCHVCQRLKPKHEFKAPLGDSMEPTLPWEVVAIDICGPFPTTPNKNRYKLARDNGRNSHTANKRYYDRSAKEHEFAVGDFVYLYNPVIKVGVTAKFSGPFTGTWRVTERRSRLNYVITDQRGKLLVVHVNLLEKELTIL